MNRLLTLIVLPSDKEFPNASVKDGFSMTYSFLNAF